MMRWRSVETFGRGALRALLGTTLALVAGTALLPVPGWAQGLNLKDAKEKTLDEFDRPNPHAELDCTECHESRPDPNNDTWATVKFANGDKGNVDLCYTCHDTSDNVHPVHVDPLKATPPLKIPSNFPTERSGEFKGTVVCSTCHFIHTKTAGMKLLRGFPESSAPGDVAKAPYKDRRDLCLGCHGATLSQKTPHKGREAGGKNCSFCHATEPKEGEPVQFVKNPVELCDFCHAATKGAHYLLVNPFADPNLTAEVAAANLPLYQGEYTCVSCHNPHGGTGLEKFLRPEFVQLALKSTRVRPHFIKAFCEACHTVKPKVAKGQPGAQPLAEIPLRSSDPNELCNRCHESGLSKANAHPLRVVPEDFKARMPQDWPLKDGALTCMTCHTGGDSPVLDPKNPNFLRGGPYESRNTICWLCHLQEEFAQLDPHFQIQNGEGCEFCHATRPDPEKSTDVNAMKFKGDVVLLCLRCHSPTAHPAGHDHTGPPDAEIMAKNNISIPNEFPLDRLGRIHCATCHNPHAGGETRGIGMEICPSCHAF